MEQKTKSKAQPKRTLEELLSDLVKLRQACQGLDHSDPFKKGAEVFKEPYWRIQAQILPIIHQLWTDHDYREPETGFEDWINKVVNEHSTPLDLVSIRNDGGGQPDSEHVRIQSKNDDTLYFEDGRIKRFNKKNWRWEWA